MQPFGWRANRIRNGRQRDGRIGIGCLQDGRMRTLRRRDKLIKTRRQLDVQTGTWRDSQTRTQHRWVNRIITLIPPYPPQPQRILQRF